MPIRELEERGSEEASERRRAAAIVRPNARLREIPERLHQEDDILKRDPCVGIVPKPWIGPRPHEHQHVAASEETCDLDVHPASEDVLCGSGEICIVRGDSMKPIVLAEPVTAVRDGQSAQDMRTSGRTDLSKQVEGMSANSRFGA